LQFHLPVYLARRYSASALLLLAGAYLMVTCMLQRRMWGVLGPGVSSGSPSASQGTGSGRRVVDRSDSVGSSGSRSGSSSDDDGGGGAQASFWAALCRMNIVMLTCTVRERERERAAPLLLWPYTLSYHPKF
jgi:hypothetical protein